MHVSADGTVHLAWADTRGRLLYLEHRAGKSSEPYVLAKGGFTPNARNPSIIAVGKQILIAFESLYDQIEYTVLENGTWRGVQHLTSFDDRLKTDVLHSPQLTLDRHGVVWLFFSDTTRRFTYFTRWLGSDWSDFYDCRGIYYRTPRFEADLLPADSLAVEKYPPAARKRSASPWPTAWLPRKTSFMRLPFRPRAWLPARRACSSICWKRPECRTWNWSSTKRRKIRITRC